MLIEIDIRPAQAEQLAAAQAAAEREQPGRAQGIVLRRGQKRPHLIDTPVAQAARAVRRQGYEIGGRSVDQTEPDSIGQRSPEGDEHQLRSAQMTRRAWRRQALEDVQRGKITQRHSAAYGQNMQANGTIVACDGGRREAGGVNFEPVGKELRNRLLTRHIAAPPTQRHITGRLYHATTKGH